MRPAFYDSPDYRSEQSKRTKQLWQKGVYNFKVFPLQTRICLNGKCKKLFQIKNSDSKKYCSRSCSASINNSLRRIVRFCKACKNPLSSYERKYCSFTCQQKVKYTSYIEKWKLGLVSGNIGIKTRHVTNALRKYLLTKCDNKCSICGWNSINPTTKLIPLEVNHIDGDAENNLESNLQILCPNCHSLTSNFRNLNKGKGRKWRKIVISE